MIREGLDGKRLFVTGTTGFLGTALVERLLRSVPGCELVLLVRPGRRSDVGQRAQREIFGNDAFDRLREEHGGRAGLRAVTDARVEVVAGDVGRDGLGLDDAGRAALASCDVVIHSAAAVSFDSALDSAVEVNLLGPTRIARAVAALAAEGAYEGRPLPHLVAVSTCYVAGNRRGAAPEQLLSDQPFSVDVDWREEVDAARRTRADEDAASRTPEALARFRAEAATQLGAASAPLLAARCEELREKHVAARMVLHGQARASALGWPDAYPYTKALGEEALVEERGDIPVTILRPSIIESALAEPRPGWIRGFRMAEPIIISYARGLLKEFPGVPEGIVDVIPVDLVVDAIIGVAARGPDAGTPERPGVDVVQVASGGVNPFRYRRLVDLCYRYFTDNPVYDRDGSPIVVPEWTFPGRGKVQRNLSRTAGALARTEKVLQALPLRGRRAEWAAGIEERRTEVDRALTYVELYGLYTECEAVYGVDRLLELWESLPEADREDFCFDPRVIDWDRYASEIHLPSVVVHGRVKTTPGRSPATTSRPERLRAQVLAPERPLAVFNLEHTLVDSNVVSAYTWLATRRLDGADRWRVAARTALDTPRLWRMDRRDRADFLRHFYRRYAGAPVDQLLEDAEALVHEHLLPRAFPEGLRRVRAHRAAGTRTVLVTGAIAPVVEPFRGLFDDVVAADMSTIVDDDGIVRSTGELTSVPPTGESRAQAVLALCTARGIDPKDCVAYADGTSDLPLLEAVGFPVAVNPEARLAAIARSRGWLTEHWATEPGARRRASPVAPRRRHGRPTSTTTPTAVAAAPTPQEG